MKAHLATSLSPAWPNIRIVRRDVGEALVAYDVELRAAAMMTASELMENAIKYGPSAPTKAEITFSLRGDADQIRIEVANQATPADVHALKLRVVDIAAAPDKRTLYMKRLTWLSAHPAESGQLGLCRVAYEGRFDLEVTHSDGVVTVLAKRGVP
jgi:hypothetical protein